MTDPIRRAGRAVAAAFLGGLLVTAAGTAPAAAQVHKSAGASKAAAPVNSLDAEIRKLHNMLHITPAQEAEFQAFAKVWRGNQASLISLVRQRPASASTNAVESLRFSQKLAAAQADGLSRLIPAFAKLYAALSPAQKGVANRIFLAPAAPPARHG